MARNQLIDMATASLSDLMKEHPEHRAEAKQDLQLLNAQKMGEHEAEIEKIKNVFLAILRDIKKDIDNGEQPGEAVTAAMFQAMRLCGGPDNSGVFRRWHAPHTSGHFVPKSGSLRCFPSRGIPFRTVILFPRCCPSMNYPKSTRKKCNSRNIARIAF